MNTEIIAFFSAAGIFRKRTVEKQREAFDAESEAFKAEFSRDLNDDDWQMLIAYQADKAEAKRKREAEKLARDAAKAAKLAAMPIAGGDASPHSHISIYPRGRYILTCAQNNTLVDDTFWQSLLVYAEKHNAKILVAKVLYNKKAFRQPGIEEAEEYWFDDKVKPYLVEGQIDLAGSHFIADANVIPTAKWPTSGFDGITPSGVNAFIPATKIELRVSAALKGAETKVISSTGACTMRNYIMRKTGAIAAFGHNIGALFVDTENNVFRHLEQMQGAAGFYDTDGFYSPSGFSPLSAGNVAALQLGDIHAEKMEAENLSRAQELILALEPANLVLHDVLDFSSRNHHNIKDCVFVYSQTMAGNTVEGDLIKLANVLDSLASCTIGQVHIVESNHDLAINTWLKNADFKADPVNALVYLDCMKALYEHIGRGKSEYFNMLAYAYEYIGGGKYGHLIQFHETDESLIIAGTENGNHGHNGANGARGNPKGFANLGVPINTGHTHSPSIYGPCYTAGVTASLYMGYNVGASSWAVAHIVTYDNGQRQILFM